VWLRVLWLRSASGVQVLHEAVERIRDPDEGVRAAVLHMVRQVVTLQPLLALLVKGPDIMERLRDKKLGVRGEAASCVMALFVAQLKAGESGSGAGLGLQSGPTRCSHADRAASAHLQMEMRNKAQHWILCMLAAYDMYLLLI
jgi:hypothetical protein